MLGAFGNTAVAVTAGPIKPNAWTFNAAAQSYTITGAGVNFGGAGLINNAAGGTISIGNAIGGMGGVQQNGAGTLVLTGANTYSGGTTISGRTVDVTNNASLDTGDATVNGDAGGSAPCQLGCRHAAIHRRHRGHRREPSAASATV